MGDIGFFFFLGRVRRSYSACFRVSWVVRVGFLFVRNKLWGVMNELITERSFLEFYVKEFLIIVRE